MADKVITFSCITCSDNFDTLDGWTNWELAGQHERATNHACVDQDRYVRQGAPWRHGISA